MELKLATIDFEHLKELSSYNSNCYKYTGKETSENFIVHEKCYEDYDFYKYALVENDIKVFLGCSRSSFQDEEIVIDFKLFYS